VIDGSNNKIKVAIDATRSRSGGAVTHLVGLLTAVNPEDFGISEVHLWSYRELLAKIPNYPWLIKHSPFVLTKSLLRQLFWQKYKFPFEIKKNNCDILLSTHAGTVCSFKPAIVMSREMLCFEPGELYRYPLCSVARLRLIILRIIQIKSLNSAYASIFLTEYARQVINKYLIVPRANQSIIPHGVSDSFQKIKKNILASDNNDQVLKCVYVSNADYYKHQWNVIKAIKTLRDLGYLVELELVGGGTGPAVKKILNAQRLYDPNLIFTKILKSVSHDEISKYLSNADIFIFASSCENLPNTLLEAMAVGLPIACSDRGPMPEILQDRGLYFDPEEPSTITTALQKLVNNKELRRKLSTSAYKEGSVYTWSRCATKTWNFVSKISKDYANTYNKLN